MEKNIWIFWLQGYESAPDIVKKCIGSWKKNNPDWNVNVLDINNFKNFITLDISQNNFDSMIPAHKSDLIRLALLSKYGGVWADATLLCIKPLNEFISSLNYKKLFMFSRPGRDRVVASWFIVAEKNNYALNQLYHLFLGYYKRYNFNEFNLKQKVFRKICNIFFGNSQFMSRFWLSKFIPKLLGIYPYFLIHYYFEFLLRKDRKVSESWSLVDKMPAKVPMFCIYYGLEKEIDESVIEFFEREDPFFIKLTYRFNSEAITDRSLLNFVSVNYMT